MWINVDADKVQAIIDGQPLTVGPQVDEILLAALDAELISAAISIGRQLIECDLVLVCVDTPSAADGSQSMSYVGDVTRKTTNVVDPARETSLVVAYRSSFKSGMIEEFIWPLKRFVLGAGAERLVRVVYTPDFLRGGAALGDYVAPPKIIIATASGVPNSMADKMRAEIDASAFYVGYPEAEITRIVDNSWHPIRVTSRSKVAPVRPTLGILAEQMRSIFVSDTKFSISSYDLHPNGAFGGSCMPKDVRVRQSIGSDVGANLHLIDGLLRSSHARKRSLFEYARERLTAGSRILLAGLTFMARTDDIQESRNVDLDRRLGAGFVCDISDICDYGINILKQIGPNLGCAYSKLPALGKLLIGRVRAAATYCDRALIFNATIEVLSLLAGKDIRHRGSLL